MDYDIVTVQTGMGMRLAAIEKRPQRDGQLPPKGEMVRIFAIAENEQELHEIVQKRIETNTLNLD